VARCYIACEGKREKKRESYLCRTRNKQNVFRVHSINYNNSNTTPSKEKSIVRYSWDSNLSEASGGFLEGTLDAELGLPQLIS